MTKIKTEWLAFQRAQHLQWSAITDTESWVSTGFLKIIDEQYETIRQLSAEISRLELLLKTALGRKS